MALVKRIDFGIALGIKDGTIRSKINRKQLCCNRNGFMDTENPKNYSYLLEINGGNQNVFDKYHIAGTNLRKKTIPTTVLEKKVTEKINKVVEVPIPKAVDVINKEPKLSLAERNIIREQKETNKTLAGFELRKKEAEVMLVERNAELKQWELEKKAGNTLPLDMIENVISINYKAVFKSIHSQIKNIAMVMVQQLGGDKNDLNGIMIELESLLDNTVKDSKRKAAVDIERLIEEYSEVRSRGERKV